MDDLYQEVFLALFKNKYKKLKQFKGKNNCSLASWLRLIASRTVIDFLRKQKNPVYLDDAVDDKKKVMETLADESDLPDKSLEKEEWYQIFKKIVQELPPRDRYLFELSYSQELPDREVAQVMTLSISAVYMRKSRIKKKLQDVIEKKKIL
jgi:RNA polymerase sigma-70 factor (ECF subfamily)